MSLITRAKLSKEYLRSQRKKLFEEYFDLYSKNVAYGIIKESAEQHMEVETWYYKCLDLDYEAINNPPECIKNIKKGKNNND